MITKIIFLAILTQLGGFIMTKLMALVLLSVGACGFFKAIAILLEALSDFSHVTLINTAMYITLCIISLLLVATGLVGLFSK